MCAQTLPSSLVAQSPSYISIQWRRLYISIFISAPLLDHRWGLKRLIKKGEQWIYWAFKIIELKIVSVPILYILTNFQITFIDMLVQFYSFFVGAELDWFFRSFTILVVLPIQLEGVICFRNYRMNSCSLILIIITNLKSSFCLKLPENKMYLWHTVTLYL